MLKPGERAVSVSVNATTGISGFVFPGDRVDVILTHAIQESDKGGNENDRVMRHAAETILTNIRVIAVDQTINDQTSEPAVAKNVTLEVTPKQAEIVSLVSELGRTAGGNSAEVLDTIVETVRERAEVRRLGQTLTAQGRLSQVVLTVLPIIVAVFLLLTEPSLMRPMYTSTGGQTLLVLCALGVVIGSLWIKRIVEIEV